MVAISRCHGRLPRMNRPFFPDKRIYCGAIPSMTIFIAVREGGRGWATIVAAVIFLGIFALFALVETFSGTEMDHQRHTERQGRLHLLLHQRGDGVEFVVRHFQHQLVVDLQQESRLHP